MTSLEVLEVIRLLRVREQWCQGREAHRKGRHPCNYDDPLAVAWSLDGALFKVLGPEKAMQTMVAFTAHVINRDVNPPCANGEGAQFEALRALKDYNDGPDAKYSVFIGRLLELPTTGAFR
jgi:hypothetical protein